VRRTSVSAGDTVVSAPVGLTPRRLAQQHVFDAMAACDRARDAVLLENLDELLSGLSGGMLGGSHFVGCVNGYVRMC